MIVKIKSHKTASFGKLLRYMLDSKERLFDKDERSFSITRNLKGNSIAKWEEQFKKNELGRLRKRKDSVILTHEILSWHKNDSKNISLSMLEDMTREYIRLRNPNGLYIAVPHFDKDHYHVHICASGVENKTGKSLRISKQNLSKLSKGIQEYQIEKYPELKHSVIQRGKGRKNCLSEREYQYKMREERATDKESLLKILQSNYECSSSLDDFYFKLHEVEIETYQRSGKVTGVVFNGKKFRFSRLGVNINKDLNWNINVNRKQQLLNVRSKNNIQNERNR